jgi:hypothetical protein
MKVRNGKGDRKDRQTDRKKKRNKRKSSVG